MLIDPLDHAFELRVGQIGWRAPAEINVFKLPAGEAAMFGIQRDFIPQGIEIRLDFRSVLIGIHPEITKLAPLAAKRNMQIQPQRSLWLRRPVERRQNLWLMLRRPNRKRRVI